jgi:uncharacterized protein YdaT
MPWDQTHFPASMKNFPAPQRGKAIEIANALLRQGVEEGKAIRIVIVRRGSGPSGMACPKALLVIA